MTRSMSSFRDKYHLRLKTPDSKLHTTIPEKYSLFFKLQVVKALTVIKEESKS